MKLPPEQAIFLFVDGIIPSSNALAYELLFREMYGIHFTHQLYIIKIYDFTAID